MRHPVGRQSPREQELRTTVANEFATCMRLIDVRIATEELRRELPQTQGVDELVHSLGLTRASDTLTESSWLAVKESVFGDASREYSPVTQAALWLIMVRECALAFNFDANQDYLPDVIGEMTRAVLRQGDAVLSSSCAVMIGAASELRQHECPHDRSVVFMDLAMVLLSGYCVGRTAHGLPQRVQKLRNTITPRQDRGWLLDMATGVPCDGDTAWREAFSLALLEPIRTTDVLQDLIARWR